MQLSTSTKINDLLAAYPFLEDFLTAYNPHFKLLKNKIARITVGRLSTLGTAARIAGADLNALLHDLASAVEEQTAIHLDVAAGGDGIDRDQRIAMLGHVIAELHDGCDLATARQHFAQAVGEADAGEIAAMEEEMIRGGLPVSEVQRLCDVHVGAFRSALDDKKDLAPPAGHPTHTYMADNKIIVAIANELTEIARKLTADADLAADLLPAAVTALAKYDAIDNHYKRKENQLFPLLERHGVTGPSQVMWGIHDQIRTQWKQAKKAAESGNISTLVETTSALTRSLVEMVYKENKILFPLALEKLTEADWAEEKRGEDELGYALARPAIALPLAAGRLSLLPVPAPAAAGLLNLGTGALSLEVVDLLLRHLPLDLELAPILWTLGLSCQCTIAPVGFCLVR
jgi:hypothetical protein